MAITIDLLGVQTEIHQCIICGVTATIPSETAAHMRKKGGYFHCISGHSQGWSIQDSEDAKTRRERDRLKQENARLADEVAAAQRAEQRAASALKSHKKRSAAGTCPCCKRTFANMATHMRRQHPSFVEASKSTGGKVLQ